MHLHMGPATRSSAILLAVLLSCSAAAAAHAPRRAVLVGGALGCLVPQPSPAASPAAAPAAASAPAAVTDRGFIDLRVIRSFDVDSGVLEDAAVRGRVQFELYGNDAPKAVERFKGFVKGDIGQFRSSSDGPSYRTGAFTTLRPGVILQGGRINGLRLTEFAGAQQYEYGSRLVPLDGVVEVNELKHDRRGLITRRQFSAGPEFGITLGPAPQLDSGWEVIGRLSQDSAGLLPLIEGLPYITGRSLEEPGSVADNVFNAQKSLFTSLSKTIGDSRAEDRTGQLLRRVEIVNCGLL
ncbi:hypothetical protein EMIHUDRAFT_434219 [Emiliania huxleyi CCMP1516]|uniref:PPIase cyclophilin-type domain-containing protein n=2 Tax=Emiliania huxleyi TaxID=2903 RepID=A0A0D3K8N4_EMIH1|nr:hypothetical protein EMIHUDRAFT_445677 [Emiliania huxleyi CCMP1516]XP_005784548.1 hypothetical protein EMIHUDRAFT_434219 [Emiliania huxleyi CCMP1516]EOD15059.1 hypothetical protein EMIHUDRAFT_445677 [Emiliania huxleyi CCMP1516]EOD32119.1 hypothetical protein EMIHUDRAFT_434219 [Emiliania huxleyi CCMP1516]|mmetsp:Transcript_3025/g.8871  ORF Transcript_3025/g.8871 Transcript_3025/m.8871 type:complete len:295 (+) Transcript_3025:82-966(+)|eukprot:XP_005767488.1 hypothetical protein EMIHUDRAFT_445677 [Emiliania huxleyi CCMP1516]